LNSTERELQADIIARRIAASCSGDCLRRNIKESLLKFPEMTDTVKILAEPLVKRHDV